jgi:3-methyladenine DNA glycosylase/8-oxoguanine DNA glycosylase
VPPRLPPSFAQGAEALVLADARLAPVIRAVGLPERLGGRSSFATLARSIAYQQLSGKAAATIWGRFLDLFDDREPDPRAVLRKRRTTLRGVGLSGAKVAAIRDLASHVADGRLDPNRFRRMEDAAIVDAITAVRGLGVWSAQMHLMFTLARMDVWPTTDLGIRKGLALLHGHDDLPHPKTAESMGEPWRPWRTVASWYLWRLVERPDLAAPAGMAPRPGR